MARKSLAYQSLTEAQQVIHNLWKPHAKNKGEAVRKHVVSEIKKVMTLLTPSERRIFMERCGLNREGKILSPKQIASKRGMHTEDVVTMVEGATQIIITGDATSDEDYDEDDWPRPPDSI